MEAFISVAAASRAATAHELFAQTLPVNDWLGRQGGEKGQTLGRRSLWFIVHRSWFIERKVGGKAVNSR